MGFESFRDSIGTGDIVENLRDGLIGEGMEITTAVGRKRLIYADYTASGRALRQVEDFIAREVLPYYANSHTESSYCGAHMTRLREDARALIAAQTNAQNNCSVIFTGSGATSAVNRLVALCGIDKLAGNGPTKSIGNRLDKLASRVRNGGRSSGAPVVFIGPYEHHSNILPWRESGAQVIEIDEAPGGGPDLKILESELQAHKNRPLLIGSFSAASNVTGILTDVDAVTRLLKAYGALAFWDYAGGGPYLSIDMNPGAGLEKDAVFLSPHKFPGGPGASGLLIVRDAIVRADQPTWPGGGSVSYVSPWGHDYHASIVEREEAGTPNVIGDIRAALVMAIKAQVGQSFILKRDEELANRALAVWRKNPNIQLLGARGSHQLPIFSFIIRDQNGGRVHHDLFTRMLSDHTGVQARGGCVCAGPYGHRLLGVGRELSEQIRRAVHDGNELQKPGWIRLNFSYLMDDATAKHIVDAVDMLAKNAKEISKHYTGDETKGQFKYTGGIDARQAAASANSNQI